MKTEDTSEGQFVGYLSINEYLLDQEWQQQPLRFMEIATQAVESRRDAEQARIARDVQWGDLCRAARECPEKFGIGKVTEGQITEVVTRHPEMVKAEQAVVAAQYQQQMLDRMVQAMEHKKRALENLVTLYGMAYFSGRSDDVKSRTEAVDAQQAMKARAAEALKERRNDELE